MGHKEKPAPTVSTWNVLKLISQLYQAEGLTSGDELNDKQVKIVKNKCCNNLGSEQRGPSGLTHEATRSFAILTSKKKKNPF